MRTTFPLPGTGFAIGKTGRSLLKEDMDKKQNTQNDAKAAQGTKSRKRHRATEGSPSSTAQGNGSSQSKGQGKNQGQGRRRPPKADQAKQLRIIPLGGLDAIGKNMTVFDYGNDMVIVDAGLMFPDDDHLGVDLLLPDYTYVLENVHRLRAIIITHGHEDHTGALPYLMKDIGRSVPLYGTRLTIGFIEGKFAEHGIKDSEFHEVSGGQTVNLGSFDVSFFSVNHSIPGSLGLYMKTPAGTVLHTGDFKLDQTPIDGITTDFAAISHFGHMGVDLMMSDSTNANNPNFTRSEAEVGKVLADITKNAKQRVIVASFSSHIHRVQQVCNAAAAARRKVAVTGRSMLTNTKIARDLGYLNVPDDLIIDAYEAKGIPPHKLVVLCTGSQGEPLSALARMSNGEHRTIDIEEGDTVIISATPVPGNEKAVTKVINGLSKIGANVYDKSRALVHVSGHAGAEELKIVLAMVRPKNFMPVHGEAVHLRAHIALANAVGIPKKNTFLLENGDSLIMENHKVSRGEAVESGVVYVDGLSVGDTDQVVLRDRQLLANDGIATVVVMVDSKTSKPLGDVELIMRGVSGGDEKTLLDEAHACVKAALEKSTGSHGARSNVIQREVREALSKLLWARCRRRPMIIPVIMEV